MEQKRKPSSKPIHPQSLNLAERKQEYTMEKRQFPQQVVLGKLDSSMEISEIRTQPHIIHDNELKMLKA